MSSHKNKILLLRRTSWIIQNVNNFSIDNNIITPQVRQVQIPKLSLHEYIWNNLDKWSNRTAAVCFDTQRSYTYYQLYKKSLALTKHFQDSLKLQQRETIALILPNVPEYPIIVLGAIQAGLQVTTCNPACTPDEIKKQLINAKVSVVFTSPDMIPLVRQASTNVNKNIFIVEVSGKGGSERGIINFNDISVGGGSQIVQNVDIDETVLLLYSSGTTGVPKGVQLTHGSIVSNLCQMSSPELNLLSDDGQDTVPVFVPMFHVYGLVMIMLNVISQGAKLVVMSKFTSGNLITLLKNYKPDVLYSVPLVVITVANNPHVKVDDLTSIRTILSGAAPLAASDIDRLKSKTKNRVHLLQGYGMTETSPLTLIQSASLENGVKAGGVGFLLPNTEAKIIPADVSSTLGLSCNQSGELLIRGPQVMKGYLNNPEANSEIFLEGGWLKTGDIAHYDEHEHFYITDRLKELIKVKGLQVAPAELEAVLRSHGSVDEAAVVGVPHDAYGEIPKAFVVLKAGRSVKAEQLQDYVAQKVAKFKQLTGGVVFVDAIPKSPSGKILRRLLKEK